MTVRTKVEYFSWSINTEFSKCVGFVINLSKNILFPKWNIIFIFIMENMIVTLKLKLLRYFTGQNDSVINMSAFFSHMCRNLYLKTNQV